MTLDNKYTNLKKKSKGPFLRKSENHKNQKIFHVNVDFRCSDFYQKLAVSTRSSLYRAQVSNFEALRFIVSKRRQGGTYIRTTNQ